ncbi:MAG: hypothetical protein ABJH64_02650 [Algoriphagus sp.]|uniref:hypothetical protein n=2 Tax=Algoriphagus sp. TaxID=1872435 RepID=UPI003296FE4D
MEKVVKREMMQVVKFVVLTITLCVLFSCTSQNNISGMIVDSKTKEPIGQVSVLLKHRDSLDISSHYLEGTVSDGEGLYSIDYKGDIEDCVLYFGMVGFLPKIVDNLEPSRIPINVELEIDTAEHVDFIP